MLLQIWNYIWNRTVWKPIVSFCYETLDAILMTLSEASYSLHFEPCQYSVRVITSLSQRYTLFQYPFLSNSLFVNALTVRLQRYPDVHIINRLIHFLGNKWKRKQHLVAINVSIYWEPHLRNDLECKLSFGA